MIGKTNSGMTKITNVIGIANETAGATITATLGSKVYTAITDSNGYAFFTNLDAGTWTLQATKTGKYVGSKTLTITTTQSVYYVKYPFRTYVYDGSLNSGGQHGANVCEAFSGGWEGSGGGGTTTYNDTNVNRTTTASYQNYLYNITPIDLTPFTTLYVKCKGNYTGIRVGVVKSNSLDWWAYSNIPDTATNTISIDLSNFDNTSGRVCMGQQIHANMSIYSAWFE